MRALVETLLREENLTKRKVENLKRAWVRTQNLDKIPLNSEILKQCSEVEADKLRPVLTTKPMRTISGISNIAIMPKPMGCPANCTYCPTGVNAPKSYTGFEPSTMRAIRNNYDPFKTVSNRIKQLQTIGHNTDKNELIIMGGTFPAAPWAYQVEFTKGAFDGFNAAPFLSQKKGIHSERIKHSATLAEAQKINETAKNRVVGLTLETRPDYVFPEQFLELGATRIEMGLQSTYDDVALATNRGHGPKEIIEATKHLKEAGFKVLLHMMLGLPKSSLEKDIQMFKELFENPDFRPDMLKVYPTLVVKHTQLYKQWKEGNYEPIDEAYAKKVLKELLKMCPKYVRIMRVQRDIPATQIEAGPTKSNLRQVVVKELEEENYPVKEIRFREAGHKHMRTGRISNFYKILVEKYEASGGKEYFISAEDTEQDILLGFCRLRLGYRPEAMLRELHVYGTVTPIGEEGTKVQHKGIGSKLLKKAEDIAREAGRKEMLVISGVGVREYYRKIHGYELKDHYMWKELVS